MDNLGVSHTPKDKKIEIKIIVLTLGRSPIDNRNSVT